MLIKNIYVLEEYRIERRQNTHVNAFSNYIEITVAALEDRC